MAIFSRSREPVIHSRYGTFLPEYGTHSLPSDDPSLDAEQNRKARAEYVDRNRERWTEQHAESKRRHALVRRALYEILSSEEWAELRVADDLYLSPPEMTAYRPEKIAEPVIQAICQQALLRAVKGVE